MSDATEKLKVVGEILRRYEERDATLERVWADVEKLPGSSVALARLTLFRLQDTALLKAFEAIIQVKEGAAR